MKIDNTVIRNRNAREARSWDDLVRDSFNFEPDTEKQAARLQNTMDVDTAFPKNVPNGKIKLTVEDFDMETPIKDLLPMRPTKQDNDIEQGTRRALEARLNPLILHPLSREQNRSRGMLPHSDR